VKQHVHCVFHIARRGDLTAINEEYLIGILDGVQTMGDDNPSSLGREFLKDFFEELLRYGIDVGGRLVKYQDIRTAQRSPHERNELLLPQLIASPLVESFVSSPSPKRASSLVRFDCSSKSTTCSFVWFDTPHFLQDVVAHGTGEKERLLKNEPYALSALAWRVGTNITAGEIDRALVGS